MTTNWKQLRYGWKAIRTTLEAVQHTQADVMSDLETDDDRWPQIFKDLNTDIGRWIQAADRNIQYCKNEGK